jgi:cytochrome c-type biogenesis protein CcmH/NrfF
MPVPRLLALAAALLLASAAGADAQTAAPGATPSSPEADAAIGRIRSPYCPGLMLEVCPSPQAELLRDSIRAMAAQGKPASAIVEDVIARHGEEWRAVPKRSGAGLWAWLAPPAVLLLGAGLVMARLRRLREGRAAEAVPADAHISDAEHARLAEALRAFEREEGVEA